MVRAYRSTMQLLVRPHFVERSTEYSDTYREQYYEYSLIFGSIKRSCCLSVRFRGAVVPGSSSADTFASI